MKASSTFSPIRAGARRRAQRGIAALEAAIVLPIMIFAIIGGMELYLYTRTIAVMDRVAFSLANGVSMQPSLTVGGSCTSPDNICTYGAIMPTLLTPLAAKDAAAIVSVYTTNTPRGGGGPTAWTAISAPNHGWSRKIYQGASAPTPTSQISAATLPTAIISRNLRTADTVIVVELFYYYKPFAVSGAFFNLLANPQQYSRAMIRPRYGDLCRLTDPTNPAPANSVCGS